MNLRRNLYSLFIVGVSMYSLMAAAQLAVLHERLDFEVDYLDLDTGTVETECDGFPCSGNEDFKFAYGGGDIHARLFHNQTGGKRAIAFLDGQPFTGVGFDDIQLATFTTSLIDLPFEPTDTIILRTETGLYFKVGIPVEDSSGVKFLYEKLTRNSDLGECIFANSFESCAAPP